MHPGDSSLWKSTERLLNQENNDVPSLRTNSKLVTFDEEKCNYFTDILQKAFFFN